MKDKTIKMFKRTFKFSLCMLLVIAIGTAFGATNSVMEQSEMSLTMFKAGLITEPTVFRVKLRIASSRYAYNDMLQNYSGTSLTIIDNFWAVEMYQIDKQDNRSRSDENLFCFVTKKSEAGKTVVEALKDGDWHVALVSLRYSKNPKFRMCCTMDKIEMQENKKPAQTTSEVSAKFTATRLSLIRGRDYQYVQGKIELTLRTELKFFKKPILRVVLLMEESGAHVVRDSIFYEPKTMASYSNYYTTTCTEDANRHYEYGSRHDNNWSIENLTTSQSEVSKDKYRELVYVGIPLKSFDSRYSDSGRYYGSDYNVQSKFGYARFDKNHDASMLGYRIELWYNGICISSYDSINASQRSRLMIPDDWSVFFKHPKKFKYGRIAP